MPMDTRFTSIIAARCVPLGPAVTPLRTGVHQDAGLEAEAP